MGMGMNEREWEGMGMKNSFPLISCFDLTRIVKIFIGDTGFNGSIVRGFVCNDGFATD
jgi:hypothetical protein